MASTAPRVQFEEDAKEEQSSLDSSRSSRVNFHDSDTAPLLGRGTSSAFQAGGLLSSTSQRLRSRLHSPSYIVLILVMSVVALFLPDLCVILDVSSNLELDIIMSFLTVAFTVEIVTLMLLDPSYICSFFHVADIVGTFSLVFDISFLLGADASEATIFSGQREVESFERPRTVRLMRAFRDVARVGLLARVMRTIHGLSLLRLADLKVKGITMVISGRLSQLLGARVTCLTSFLVIVMPLIEIHVFPEHNNLLQVWVDRIDAIMEEGEMSRVSKELDTMVGFFASRGYKPYQACRGAISEHFFDCELALADWFPRSPRPARGSSTVLVRSETVMVAFNMKEAFATDARHSMIFFALAIGTMIVTGSTLSNVVTDLAVRPLERMLLTVRQIASEGFKLSAGVADEDGEDDLVEEDSMMVDVDKSSEMILLEKVVKKLAIVANLQSGQGDIVTTEDMENEDIAVITMMSGRDASKPAGIKYQKSVSRSMLRATCSTPNISRAIDKGLDLGVSQEMYQSWAFNTLQLTKAQRCAVAKFAIQRFHEPGEGFVTTREDEATLQRFVAANEASYQPNPYHNFAHAVDVLHSVARFLNRMSTDDFLGTLDQFCLLIAALAHDVGHPGVNNPFLSETGHELALQYNDHSPLENMHCARLYGITANPENNVFGKLTREQYKEARKCCIRSILHTDMINHNQLIKDLNMLYQMHTEAFTPNSISLDDSSEKVFKLSQEEIDVLSRPENKALVMDTVLPAADVSSTSRAWEVTHAWAMVCLEEFFEQGDLEKSLGIPIQFLNDRDKLNKPNSQVGFIEFMIFPFYTAVVRLWPRLSVFTDNLSNNICAWEDASVKENCPSDEERAKLRARVEKVQLGFDDAKMRRMSRGTA